MAITAAQVKELREKTGAGMMDCKKALVESDGDVEKAVSYLREKGIAKAAKKAGRETNEGLIVSYIHPGSKLGTMVEISCETDFVARTDDFQQMAKDIAMHIAAGNPLALRREDLDQDVVEKEKEIFRTQALNEGKPEKIIDRIIEGKLEKFFSETCLLEQAFVKDPDQTINQLVEGMIAKLGENMSIKRYIRFRIGEE